MTQIITNAIAGPFKATYAGPSGSNPSVATLGVIGDGGIRQIKRYEIEEYSADLSGNSMIEGVWLGGQMFLEFTLEEANLRTVRALCNQFNSSPDSGAYDQANEMGVPGTFVTSKAGQIVLSPLYSGTAHFDTTAGHEGGADGTKTIRTYGLVAMAGGFELEQLYSSKRRKFPVRLRCYPYSDGSSPAKYIWYSLSDNTTYAVV